MAISIDEQYPGKTAGTSTEYPLGKARNVTTPGDGTGTPWEQAIVNDDQGFKQALLAAAGITPSGVPDTAIVSQYLEAFIKIIESKSIGFGQKWTDVKASRSSGVLVPNTTGRPIQAYVAISDTNGGGFTITIRNKDMTTVSHTSPLDIPPGGYYPFSFVVPEGGAYSLAWAGSNMSNVSFWWELK